MSCPKEYLDFFHKAVAFSDKSSFVIPLPPECLSDVEEESKKLGVEIKVRSRKANSMVFTRRKKTIMLYYSGIEDIYQTELGNNYFADIYRRFSTCNQDGNAPLLEPKVKGDL